MIKKYGILILIMLSFVINGTAQEKVAIKDPTILINKLKTQAKETKSIIASFKQEKYVSFMKEPQFSEGIFYYQQPDKMRWQQNTPFSYILLLNKDKIRIKDNHKEKNIAGANKMMGKINTLILGLINGKIFDSKEFIIRYFVSGKLYIIELTPKNKRLKSIFNTIKLTFSKDKIRLKKLTFIESSGDKSIMNFFNEKYNQSITESIFLKL